MQKQGSNLIWPEQARYAVITLALAAVYYFASKLGFSAAFTAKQVTLVWPPTGIALAAVLLLGYRVWPGILLGAFLANYSMHASILGAVGIATGNTLEAVVGIWMLRQFIDDPKITMNRLKDVIGFLLFAGILAPMISATIGVSSLCFTGEQPWSSYSPLWMIWWMGDVGGAFVIAPALIVWLQKESAPAEHRPFYFGEAFILFIALILYCIKALASPPAFNIPESVLIYMIFPFIIWSALRLGQRGTTIVTLIVSSVAVWGVLHMTGPFISTSTTRSLLQLDIFMAVVSATGLLLSAAIAERSEVEGIKSLLASIVESSGDAMISKTLDGTITSWNKGAERTFGYTAEEAVGRNIALIMPPDRQQEESYLISQLREGKRVEHYETVRVTKDGRRIDISLALSPVRDSTGKIIGASKVSRDITDRKEVEKKIQAAHRYLKDMLDELPDPIFMKDKEHRLIGGNKAFWSLMNGPPEKFIGKTDYNFFSEQEADQFWKKENEVFDSGKVDISELIFLDSKGERHILSTKKAAFLNENNEKLLVGVIRDITQMKVTEAQLLKYTKDLERSNQELDDFAYIVSHDMKEPLRGIQNFSKFLLEDYEDKLDEEGVQKLNRLIFLGKRMTQLVDDLLYFSRLGRSDLAIQDIDLNMVIADIQRTLETALKEKNAQIVMPRALPHIVCNRPGITEVFRNLITNALKYNDKPEKTIEIGILEHVHAPHGEERNVFYVKDNGIGVPPEFHQTIFQIFKRLPNSSSFDSGGSGVGLTFVKKIIERNHGHIWLTSEVGKGSTFYFTFG